MQRLFLIVTLLLLSTPSHAYVGDPEQQLKEFFHDIQKAEYNSLFKLFSNNPMMKGQKQQILALQQQLTVYESRFGKVITIEKIHEEHISTNLVRFVILSERQYHPIVWELYFYKAPKLGWIVSQATFNESFNLLNSYLK